MKTNKSMIKKKKSLRTRLGIYLVITLAIAPLHAMEQTPATMQVAALFVCKTCKKDFTHESILRAHEQNHTGEKIKPYACHQPDCGYACSEPTDLVSHERRTHPKNDTTPNCLPCTFQNCRCICVGKCNLTKHIYHDHTRPNPTPAMLTRHKASQNPLVTPSVTSLVVIATAMTNTPAGTTHAIEQKNPAATQALLFTCKTCGKDFTYESILRAHEQNHTDEKIKPYACHYPDCSYACRRTIDLVSHERRTHPTRSTTPNCRPCTFPGCRCICVGDCNLTRHIHHDHASPTPITADNTKQSAPQELLVTPPVTPLEFIATDMASTPAGPTQETLLGANQTDKYTCSVCGKKCSCPSTLVVHMRKHTGEKPFKCDAEGCNHTFKSSSHLNRHKLSHSEEKSFKCDHPDCEYACKRSDNLKAHKMTHTKKRTAPETLDQVVKRHDTKNTQQCETDTETESEMEIAHEKQ